MANWDMKDVEDSNTRHDACYPHGSSSLVVVVVDDDGSRYNSGHLGESKLPGSSVWSKNAYRFIVNKPSLSFMDNHGRF